MTRRGKLILGLATLWPVIYVVIFMGFCFYLMIKDSAGPQASAEPPFFFTCIVVIHGFTSLWIFGLLLYYICNVFANPAVPDQKRALWAVVLFLGNFIAMPVYWYLYVWSPPEGAQGTALHRRQ